MSRKVLTRVKGYTRRFKGKAVRVAGHVRRIAGTRRGKAAMAATAIPVAVIAGYGARRYIRKRRATRS